MASEEMLFENGDRRTTDTFIYYKLTYEPKSKREIIQSLIYRILPKVDQVIYTLDTIYDSNIMTLAQAVLEIFCSQASIGL